MQQVLYDRRSMIHPVPRGAKDRIQYSWWDLLLGSSFEMDATGGAFQEEIRSFPFRKRKRSCAPNESVSSLSISVASEPEAKKPKRYSLAAIFTNPIKPIFATPLKPLFGTSRQSTLSRCEEEQPMLPRKSLLRRSCSILRSSSTAMGPPPPPSPRATKSVNITLQQPANKDMRHRLTRSWSQSFASLNKSLQKKEIKRQEAIYELYSSELCMVEDLQLVKKTYLHSLVHLKILTEQEAWCIFENLDELLNLHTELCDKLDALKSANGFVETVGKVIVEWIPGIQCYSSYCLNHFRAKKVFTEKTENSLPFRDFLQRCLESPFSRKLDLITFLDMPRTRLVKYPLLIREIIRHTDPCHQDYTLLEKGIAILKPVLKKADQAFGMAECSEFVSKLVWPSHLKPDDIESASAVFCNGELKDHKGNKVYCFLFDIGFLMTRQAKGNKYTISHNLIKSSELQVSELQPLRTSRNTSRTFQVSSDSSNTFVMVAETEFSKSHWVKHIQSCSASSWCGQKRQVTQRPLSPPPPPPTKDIETFTVVESI